MFNIYIQKQTRTSFPIFRVNYFSFFCAFSEKNFLYCIGQCNHWLNLIKEP